MWLEDKTSATGLDDLLNYEALVAPGVVMNSDGAFLAGYFFLGPDLEYASPEEKERLSTQINAAALRCGTGWMFQVDHIPCSTTGYLPQGAFTDPMSALIDEEARRRYNARGYFESVHALTITYKPPPEIESQVSAFFVEGPREEKPGQEAVLAEFERAVDEIAGLLKGALTLQRMNDADLLSFLHWCVTGINQPLAVPPVYVPLSTVIADQPLVTGWYPQIGDLHVRVLSFDGYSQGTEPDALRFLYDLPMEFRWSTRFIFLDRIDAEKLIGKKQIHWSQKRHSGKQFAGEIVSGVDSRNQNMHALGMERDANEAAEENESGAVLFGFVTMTLMVMDEDASAVNAKRKTLQHHIQRFGYGCRQEQVNAVEALRGSWPGHGYQNLRRDLIQTLNLADMLPLTSVWAGLETNPNPYYPQDSPPLMLGVTTGQTSIRIHTHVSDIGHALINGPTGAGKSYAALMAFTQHGRYPDSWGAYFGKGESCFVVAHAMGAPYYNLGEDGVGLCPLSQVDDQAEREWALNWIDGVLELQGLTMTPHQRNAVERALFLLGESTSRTMTDFVATVQDAEIRAALQHYTLGHGAGDLLDAETDGLRSSRFVFFETEALLGRGPKASIPVLRYVTHWVERRCQEGKPGRIVMDEENLHESQLAEWLRGMRKKNVAVMVTMHSMEDVEKSPYRSVLMDSCKTKFFLPNPEARNQLDLYGRAGLNEQQASLLSVLTDKQDYFYVAEVDGKQRSRVFSLQAGPVARAIIGAGGREDIARAKALIAQYGEEWGYYWLMEKGCIEEAKWWRQWRERHSETDEQRRRKYDTQIFLNGNGSGTHGVPVRGNGAELWGLSGD
jgi:type IV secretion system protein TrbE